MNDAPVIHGDGVLGQKVEGPSRSLDTFDLPVGNNTVVYTSDEVTSNCPITGQPDWYEVIITLFGCKRGIESKSLKLYLQSFRDDAAFCEQFAEQICRDASDAVCGPRTTTTPGLISDEEIPFTAPGTVSVEVKQKPRGGVSIKANSVIAR